MKKQLSLLFLTFCFHFAPSAYSQSILEEVNSITPVLAKKHIEFLASDSLLGRKAPSKGLEIAAEYIVDNFRKIGLKPVNGSYYQPVTLYQPR